MHRTLTVLSKENKRSENQGWNYLQYQVIQYPMTIKRGYIYVGLALLAACATFKTDSFPIEGIWSYIEDDDNYGEIIFTTDHYWLYTENAGVTYNLYKIQNDSLYLLGKDGLPYITERLVPVSENEFMTTGDVSSAKFKRLQIKLDTAALIRGDEKVLDSYVFDGLRVRKYEWEFRDKN